MTVLPRIGTKLADWLRALTGPSRIPPERRKPLWPLKGWILVAAVAAILAVVGSMLLLDVFLVREARLLPKWVRHTFEWITWFGLSGWYLWPTGIVLLLVAASPWPKLPRFSQAVLETIAIRSGFIFLAVGVPGLFVAILKRFIGRARPYVTEVVDPFAYAPFAWKSSYASLPSGHATTAFALAIAVGALWPRWRLPMWIFSVLIAVSRVVVNAHFPSDVIAGAIAGVVGAMLVRGWFAARKLGFMVDREGVIHRLPGPSWQRTKEVARRLFAQ